MKKIALVFCVLALISCSNSEPPPSGGAPPPAQPPSSTIVEEPKPVDQSGGVYANDLGPAKAEISDLSETARSGYRMLLQKCTQCHTSARPLNAQFVEVSEEKLAQLKKTQSELFSDKHLMHIETEVWKRKVKQMMSKPGAQITSAEAGAIYKFLTEYYLKKLDNPQAWREHRKKLLEEFKKKHPDRYQLLYGEN